MGTLSREAVEGYMLTYKQTFGKDISYEEAEKQGLELLRLFRIIYRSSPQEWPDQVQKGGENTRNYGKTEV